MSLRGASNPQLISDIAESENIPKKFLERILLELKQVGILSSKKGKGGGYYLAKDPAQISVGQVIRAVDGSLAPVSCVDKSNPVPCRECPKTPQCPLHYLMEKVMSATTEILDKATIADLATHRKELQEHPTARWYEI